MSFIATESAGEEFQQRVPEAETVREEARSMVGGAAIAVDALARSPIVIQMSTETR
jgi:hypothetical protein